MDRTEAENMYVKELSKELQVYFKGLFGPDMSLTML
jgi:hypothetical protein